MVRKKKEAVAENEEIQVFKVERGEVSYCVLGLTPLITEAMSEKVKRELLLPKGRKTAADKAGTAKHDVLEEYRNSTYQAKDDTSPTRIVIPSTAFKGALRDVATDIPGAAKAQIGRLAFVKGYHIPVFGVPQLIMSVVRNSDQNHTPDIRTRAILPRWACYLTIEYTIPLLNDVVVTNLLAAAGLMRGIGGWRPQKGAGDFGQFTLVDQDNPEFLDIVATGGREPQDLALADPECFDSETVNMLSWFMAETKRRGLKVVS